MLLSRLFALGAAAVASGTVAAACAPQLSVDGLVGRAAQAKFSNRTATGRHEYWAPRAAKLFIYAAFDGETDEYDHHVLGAVRNAKGMTIQIRRQGSEDTTCPAEVNLPPGQVFEDIAPRFADLNGDGMPEVIVVQSSTSAGARLAVYDRRARLVAATPYIGHAHRWLAPAGAADLDGDGFVELVYVDRPHLAKILRVWRFRNGELAQIAEKTGLTNHRIGWEHIPGGIRDCGGVREIVTASGDWRRIVATRFQDGVLESRDLGLYDGPGSLNAALGCG